VQVRYGVAAAIAAGMLATGCGSSDGGTDSATEAREETSATPEKAIQEIAAVRKGLDQAMSTYRSGDKAKADDQVGDTYLQHFELVEGPLEKVDGKLKENLEDGIREELRGKIKAGASQAEVDNLYEEIDAELDKAEAALR
jgi:major membrane immunogen (membrane-anchored lipoprotein)